MNRQTPPAASALHAQAMRLARECRVLIQGGFREEEWNDIDWAFYEQICVGLEEFRAACREAMNDQPTHRNG